MPEELHPLPRQLTESRVSKRKLRGAVRALLVREVDTFEARCGRCHARAQIVERTQGIGPVLTRWYQLPAGWAAHGCLTRESLQGGAARCLACIAGDV